MSGKPRHYVSLAARPASLGWYFPVRAKRFCQQRFTARLPYPAFAARCAIPQRLFFHPQKHRHPCARSLQRKTSALVSALPDACWSSICLHRLLRRLSDAQSQYRSRTTTMSQHHGRGFSMSTTGRKIPPRARSVIFVCSTRRARTFSPECTAAVTSTSKGVRACASPSGAAVAHAPAGARVGWRGRGTPLRASHYACAGRGSARRLRLPAKGSSRLKSGRKSGSPLCGWR